MVTSSFSSADVVVVVEVEEEEEEDAAAAVAAGGWSMAWRRAKTRTTLPSTTGAGCP